ncbi:hypothetical protein [Mucilaginibacter sp.]|uniref:hypothetical protein n=1 Tax=Mucilaginibacter sp. TaxID=1882438 RepID=UPI0025D14A36|nr:hypothetical protein [Mucilaginibacter sp.]
MPCTLACNSHSKKHTDKFYDTISVDWDYVCIPIIKPYKAGSTDNSRSWLLELDIANTVMLSRFGVSKNFIYGYGDEVIIDGQQKKGWFAFDINSKLLAVYSSRQELTSSLNELNISVNNIVDCNKYMDSLANGYDLSWYPKAGKKYPSYPEIEPKDVVEIKVSENPNGKLDFFFNPKLQLHKNKIYFFKISYNKKQNNLYYLSIADHQCFLVKDNLLVPVFIDKKQTEIVLYTPVPVAEEKNIPGSKRFLKTKTLSIQ